MIRRSKSVAFASGIVATLLLTACSEDPAPTEGGGGGNQRGNAGMSAVQDRSFSTEPEHLFVEKCSMCHRQVGMGTVLLGRRVEEGMEMLEDRDDLTPDYVIAAARQGIGNMPRIPRGEVSDAQLQLIADYLAKGRE